MFQKIITGSKLVIETPEKGGKSFHIKFEVL